MILSDTRTELSGLSFLAGEESEAITIVGTDADVTITDITVRALGDAPGSTNAVFWETGASGALRDSHIEGWVGLYDDVTVIVEGNELAATCLGVWGAGADVVSRDNVIHGWEFEKGIEVDGGNTVLIEGNDIWVEEVDPGPSDPNWGGREGIQVTGTGDGQVTIRSNVIHDSLIGLALSGSMATEVTANTVRDNETGITPLSIDLLLSGNTIVDNLTDGVRITSGSPTVQDNTISGNRVGLSLGFGSLPMLEGNRICDNEQNSALVDSGDLPDLAGNEICTDT